MRKKNPNERDRYPLNAEGPFYVEDGECLACMAPEYEASELMGYDSDKAHCYFKRQPNTPEELEHAINAVACSEVGALRYGGDDDYILERLMPYSYACDALCCKYELRGIARSDDEYRGEGTKS